jgi:hypothetical protein
VVRVDYLYEFAYREFSTAHFPVLQVEIFLPGYPENKIDVDAYLDSGSQRSLFNGLLIGALGGELINNRIQPYSSTIGDSVQGYLHGVELSVPGVGNFNLEVGFSDRHINRNLLGRDFFNLVQIGFREHQLKYYLTPSP